jgi:hypothetical protein
MVDVIKAELKTEEGIHRYIKAVKNAVLREADPATLEPKHFTEWLKAAEVALREYVNEQEKKVTEDFQDAWF